MEHEKHDSQHLEIARNDSLPADDKTSNHANVGEAQQYDPKWEKRTVRKIDVRLLIILGCCYTISLIDRTNISVARVAGMQQSLRLDIGERYSIISLLFFVPYIIFELPSNVLLRKLGARVWLSFIVFGFGVIMIGMAFVTQWWQLAICRVLLGLLEAGFFPGCVYLVSSWYCRKETGSRMAVFYLLSMVISGFSNIIGYGFSTLSGKAGLIGWQWVFLLFGIITVFLAIVAAFLIVDFPEKSTFLTEEQKAWAIRRIEMDRADSQPDPLTGRSFLVAAADPKIWVYALLFMTATTGAYAFSFFLPVILAGQGYSTQLSLLLSAPPYVFAAIYTFVMAILSDKFNKRAPFIATSNVVCIVGLAITAYAGSVGVRYFGTFLTIAGTQSNVPAVLAYSQNNVRMSSKRAVTSAAVIGFGGIGGIIASTVFRQADFPRYFPGLWTTIGLNLFSICACGFMTMYFMKRNRLVDEGKVVNEGLPGFKYTL